MSLSRYIASEKINGIRYGTSEISTRIKQGIDDGSVSYSMYLVKEGDRLDTIAGEVMGDAGSWWAIAAASGIGWGLQVPPGTLLKIPSMGSVTAMIFSKV
jgi:nucleoid-associated protein YgaU